MGQGWGSVLLPTRPSAAPVPPPARPGVGDAPGGGWGAWGSPRLQLTLGSPHGAQAWLRLYGYLPQPSRQMSTMRSAQIFSAALAEMQRFYGITVTGVLDEETKA